MPSSFPLLFDQHNYFVWPNSTALEKTFESADTIDAIFITNHSPAYVSSNCSCNSWKSYFTFATPSTSFTFGGTYDGSNARDAADQLQLGRIGRQMGHRYSSIRPSIRLAQERGRTMSAT